jgi:hypothetical protein
MLEKIPRLKTVHAANLGQKPLPPFQLLNSLDFTIKTLFPNVSIGLRIFYFFIVRARDSRRSFNMLFQIKECQSAVLQLPNELRNTGYRTAFSMKN